jgi:hypothetical protein
MKIKRKSEDVYLDFKMKAGTPPDIFNNYQFKQLFIDSCAFMISNKKNIDNFNVMYRKVNYQNLILFGKDLIINRERYYLPYIYYLENDQVKFKKIEENPFRFENISFEDLQRKNLIRLLLEKISDPKQTYIFGDRNDIFYKLVDKLNQKMQEHQSQQYPPQPYPPQQYPPQQYPPQQYPPKQYSPQQYPPQQYSPQQYPPQQYPTQPYPPQQYSPQQLQPQQYSPQQYPPQQYPPQQYSPQQYSPQQYLTNSSSDYRCEDPSVEVNIKKPEEIFFGYDENLFTQSQDGSYKFYYKYSYRQGTFIQLTKNQNKTLEEKPIDIGLIPTYDILCLNLAVEKLQNQKILQELLQKRIDKAKENISKTGEAFYKLDDSNFQKEKRNEQILNANLEQKKVTNIKHKNFGKVKKRRVTGKTYIFFGARERSGNTRNYPPKFGYVCFREDDKVFYYEKGKLNEKKPLSNFPFIYPLEDLISFILLRRMITNDLKFADQIYNEATARIKFLKTQKIPDKMLVKQFPEEYQSFQGQPLRATQQSQQQISLLPRSKNAINKAIQIFENF